MDDPADDDKTPPRGKRSPSKWGDERRAAVGREHRGGDSMRHQQPSLDSERHRRPSDYVERELGGPGEIEPEITKPWDMLDRDQLKPDELEIVRRSRRDSNDPVVFGDIAKITALQFRHIKELLNDRSTRKEQADAILELIRHPPNEAVTTLQDDVAQMRRELGTPHSENKGTVQENIARGRFVYRLGAWLAGVALTGAIGSVGYVAAALRSSGADEVLRAQMRSDIDDLKRENRELRREIERRKDTSP